MQSDWFNALCRFPCCALLVLSCHVTQLKIQVMIGWVGQSTGAQCAQCFRLMEVAGDLLIPDLNSDWFELICEWEKLFWWDQVSCTKAFCWLQSILHLLSLLPKFLKTWNMSTGTSEIKVVSRDELVWRNLEVFHQSLLESFCSALGNASQKWQWRIKKSYIEKPKSNHQKDDQYMSMWSLQIQGCYDLLK